MSFDLIVEQLMLAGGKIVGWYYLVGSNMDLEIASYSIGSTKTYTTRTASTPRVITILTTSRFSTFMNFLSSITTISIAWGSIRKDVEIDFLFF